MVIFLEFFMTFHRAGIDTNHQCACLGKLGVAIPEGTGLLRADQTFILRIKKNDQNFFSQVIGDVEQTVMLVMQGKQRNRIANLDMPAL